MLFQNNERANQPGRLKRDCTAQRASWRSGLVQRLDTHHGLRFRRRRRSQLDWRCPEGSQRSRRWGCGADAGSTASIFHGGHDEILPTAAPHSIAASICMPGRCTSASSITSGQTLVHKNIDADPDRFLPLIRPYREGLVVGGECMFAWYWLADLCAAGRHSLRPGPRPVHEGHSRRQDQERQDRLAEDRPAAARRHAAAWPTPIRKAMRATRDLLRRRDAAGPHAGRGPGPHPEHGQPVQPAAAGQEADLRRQPRRRRRAVRRRERAADGRGRPGPDRPPRRADPRAWSCTWCGTPRSTTRRPITCCRRSPASARSWPWCCSTRSTTSRRFADVRQLRLVLPAGAAAATRSAGKKSAGKGHKIGNAHLRWAFGEAACLMLREVPAGPELRGPHGEAARQGQGDFDSGGADRPHRVADAQTKGSVRCDQVPEIAKRRRRRVSRAPNWANEGRA